MTIAELFVKVAVGGGKAAAKELGGVQEGLKSISEASFAVKAAMFGAFYGIERLTEAGAAAGSDLTKFAASTGLSAQQLQKWIHVGKKYDVQASEIQSTMENLVKLQQEFAVTGAMPATAGLLGIDLAKGDAFELASHLANVTKHLTAAQRNYALAPFGVSANMAQMFSRMDLEKDMRGAPQSSAKELASLARTKAGYDQFYESLQKINMEVTADIGPSITGFLMNMSHGLRIVLKDAKELGGEFPKIKTAVELAAVGIAALINPALGVAAAVAVILEQVGEGKKGTMGQLLEWRDKIDKSFFDKVRAMGGDAMDALTFLPRTMYAEAMGGGGAAPASAPPGPINVEQNFYADREHIPPMSKDALTEVVRDASYQRSGIKRNF